jgi:multiple sugar transport system permease protein
METKKRLDIDYKFSMKNVWLNKFISKRFWSNVVFRIVFYLLLLDLAFVFLYPFMDMIITSLKTQEDLLDITVKWIPNKLFLTNYRLAINALSYMEYFKNSFIVTTLATAGHVIGCSCVAYGFARYKFPGRNVLFALIIFTMIVPVQVVIFPLYMQFSKMEWLNTYLPLIVPTLFGFGLRGGLFIFLFRQFFFGLPYEMEEAARIDGCSSLGVFWRIMLPMSRSAILVSIVLSMVWHWNDYFEPSMYLTRPSLGLLPSRLPGLYSLLNAEQLADGQTIFNEAIVLAATFLVIVPILIVYAFLQKKFMEGIERSGLTGQ